MSSSNRGGIVRRKSESVAQSFDSLPSEQRAERYRQLANDAMQKAQGTSDPERRAEYITMATSWHNLAVETERTIRNDVLREFAQADTAQGKSKDTH
jgi:hypothetical protein